MTEDRLVPNTRSLLTIENMPFHLGPMPTPTNFEGLPNTYPFELAIDTDLGILRQLPLPDVEAALERAYQHGNVLGTPLVDDAFGSPYVEDFLDFLERHAICGRRDLRILEVGAGAGFISLNLRQRGHRVTSIEPGAAYASYWERYGIDVLNTFFPTSEALGPFDLIVSYAVLEHLPDAVGMLRTMAEHLAPDGAIVAAVPNDNEEIVAGDPGMLIHEHYLYFTPGAYTRLLEGADLRVDVQQEGKHSRVLFAVARPGKPANDSDRDADIALFDSYAVKFGQFRRNIATALEDTLRAGRSLAVYCPARALAVLPTHIDARFFDDASYLKGKYFPPFAVQIEDKSDLVARPTDEVWIMSRSFADVIAREIAPATVGAIVRSIQTFEQA